VADPTPVAPRWASPVTLMLSLVGLAVSAYLTFVHYTTPTALSCPNTGLINCVKVTTSPQSMLFGTIPVAVTGLAYFAAMTALTTPWAWRTVSPLLRAGRLAAAVAGIGMVCYLVYVELVVVDAICLWCTAVHVLTFMLFVAVLAATVLRPLSDGDGLVQGT
jgi:uncharacterized membrane protein